MCDDLGACGECELFENDLDVLGDTWLMGAFMDLEDGEDETDPKYTAWCSHAVKYGDPEHHDPRAGYVAEDTPACPDKVEPTEEELAADPEQSYTLRESER